ncbi:MAG: two-component system sensor histidine kinase/response regulator [Caulobacterales bacterium 32-69-10]|nr:MAG: two-component system sensor histidine kinase/response regulator [Caulobacterales bacterium 32-69-10]
MTLEGATARPHVLYIDDDAALCRLVSRGLERRGFVVTTVNDGAEGVERARGGGFDVIAIDHYMPGQLGLDTLAQLKALPDPAPVVYVTGSDEIAIAVAALKAGAADYVIKSAAEDFSTLLASALEQALSQVSLRRGKEEAEQALRAANERLEAIVSRQAVLLREVNHRVANSLQLVASLVHLQASALTDAKAIHALRATEARIGAIMQVHRRLYTSDDVQFVQMDEYLAGLVSELDQSVSGVERNRLISLSAEPVQLATDKAVSVGVVVAELVTNALKYAYGPDDPGEVRIVLKRDGAGRLELVVEDDGRGMTASVQPRGTGLGQTVVAAMARSLDTRLSLDPDHRGVRAVLSFAG